MATTTTKGKNPDCGIRPTKKGGGFRWFRSGNVVSLEQFRRMRKGDG
jgi:hypothetical protein